VPSGAETEIGHAWLIVRPEVVRVTRAAQEGDDHMHGVIRDLAFRGAGHAYQIDVAGLPEALKAEIPAELGAQFEVGSEVSIAWDLNACGLLPR